MRTVDAAKLSLDLLAERRSLVVLAGFVTAGASVVRAAELLPVVGFLLGPTAGVVYFFVEPFLAGGLLGAVDEAMDRGRGARTAARRAPVGTDTFLERAREHYGALLAARLVVAPALVVYVLATAAAGATAQRGLVAAAEGEFTGPLLGGAPPAPDPTVLAVLAVGGLALALAAVPVVVLQFYPAAIVVGGAEPLASFRYSYDLVREAPVEAVGYTVVTAAASVPLLVGPVLAGVAARQAGVEVLAAGAGSAVTTGLMAQAVGSLAVLAAFVPLKLATVAFVRTYHVAFVRATLGPTTAGSGPRPR